MTLPLIVLLGQSGAGKNVAGDIITAASGGRSIAFADKLKEICCEMFDLSHDDLYTEEGEKRASAFDCFRCPTCGSLETEIAKTEDNRPPYPVACKRCSAVGDPKTFKSKWTNRAIAQWVGTEGFRTINPNVWVDYVLRKASHFVHIEGAPLVVVTDARFRSECEGAWKVGGAVWRIKRPSATGDVGIKGHASETEQASIGDGECQAVINNDGTIAQFKEKVLAQLKLFWSTR